MQTTINQRIKILVDYSKLSARKFSKELGVGETTTQNYLEPGNREPGARYLERLTKRFESMDARWLLTGEGEAFPSGVPTIIQTQEKNTGNVIGTNHGTATVNHLAECEKDLRATQDKVALLETQVQQLTSQLADKQEIIDLLKQAK